MFLINEEIESNKNYYSVIGILNFKFFKGWKNNINVKKTINLFENQAAEDGIWDLKLFSRHQKYWLKLSNFLNL